MRKAVTDMQKFEIGLPGDKRKCKCSSKSEIIQPQQNRGVEKVVCDGLRGLPP